MKKVVIILITTLLVGCHSYSDQSKLEANLSQYNLDVDDDIAIEPPRTASPSLPPALNEEYDSARQDEADHANKDLMIIKNGQMTLEVEDLNETKGKVDTIIEKYKGYYQNEDYYSTATKSGYQLTLRVPVRQFNVMVNELSDGLGKITSKDINASDVTEEYLDLEMRLANNQEYVARYLKLLNRADSIKDMLVIQEKMRQLEEEIESKKGRMQYLRARVSYSTLDIHVVTLHHPIAEVEDEGFVSQLRSSFVLGYNNVLSVIIGIVGIWPLILLGIVVVYLFRRLIGRRVKGTNPSL